MPCVDINRDGATLETRPFPENPEFIHYQNEPRQLILGLTSLQVELLGKKKGVLFIAGTVDSSGTGCGLETIP